MIRPRRHWSTSLLGAVLSLACAGSETPDESASGPPELVITAMDFAFQMRDSVQAGLTRIRLVNNGPALHHAQLIRFDEGKGLADLMAHMQSGATSLPEWAHEAGGPNPPEPGQETNTTQVLLAGPHAVVCFVDLPDHVPHLMKGMSKEFVVTPSTATAAAEPTPTTTVTLSDYAFAFSTPLTVGRHTVRVDNAAAQPHEIAIMKLEPGKTVEDLMAFAQTYEGEAPFKSIGGVAGIAAGTHAWFDVELTAGDYVMLCFVTDVNDGKPHLQHGMMQSFTIAG